MKSVVIILALIMMQLNVNAQIDPGKVEEGDVYECIRMGDHVFLNGRDYRISFLRDEIQFSVESLNYYLRAAQRNSFVAHIKIGFCYLFLTSRPNISISQLKDSEDAFLKALSLSNNLTEGDLRWLGESSRKQDYLRAAYYGLACCYWRKGEYSMSEQYLLKTIQSCSEISHVEVMIDALRLMGYWYAQKQDYKAAVGCFSTIIRLGKDPGFPEFDTEVRFRLGVNLYMDGAKEKAYDILRNNSKWQEMHSHYNSFWNERKGDFSNRVRDGVFEIMKSWTICKVNDISYTRLWNYYMCGF